MRTPVTGDPGEARAVRSGCWQRWAGVSFGALLGASACGHADSRGLASTSSDSASSLDDVLAQYRDWEPRTAEPIGVAAEIFVLCRSPTLAENAFVESEHGSVRLLLDWLNPAARDGFAAQGTRSFSPGSAIVKEKLRQREAAQPAELVAIGIMLKHDAGFDAARGDWEFGYWEAEPGLLDGPEQAAHCGGCHASSATDFVFLDDSWRAPSEAEVEAN